MELGRLSTSEGCVINAKQLEVVAALEGLVAQWCQQIEQVPIDIALCAAAFNDYTLPKVLAEGSQMRKEADDTGPLAELEYWKHRTAKFSCLVDQIKTQPCRGVINTLNIAKSKIIKVCCNISKVCMPIIIVLQQWRELDCHITDASNEARDNLKFLYSIEELCQPLYVSNPTAMLDSLPALINTILMIHAVSRYYHTSERMTSLFVKVYESLNILGHVHFHGSSFYNFEPLH